MADLETAADAALVRVKEFETHVEEAQASFAALQEEAERVSSQLDSDWSALSEAAEELLRTVEEQRGAFDQEGREAVEALSGLAGAVGAAQAEAEGELRGASQALIGFSEQVVAARPPLTQMGDDVKALAESVAERARTVEAELEQALAEARDLLGVQVVEDLRQIKEGIEQRAEALETMVTGECLQALDDSYQDFEAKLVELEDVVRQKAFDEPAQHVQDVIAFAAEECKTAHTAALDELGGLAAALEEDLTTLRSAVEQHRAEAEQDGTALQGETGLMIAMAEAAVGALRAIKDLMASYSFVEF